MEGAFVIRHVAFCVLGNIITSLIACALVNTIISLSRPKAMPPCGGAPRVSASNKNPNRKHDSE